MSKLDKLEFAVFQSWLPLKRGQPEKVLVAVSGGLDSMMLARILTKVGARKGSAVIWAHVHHGPSKNISTAKYRDRAQACVSKNAKSLGVDLQILTLDRTAEDSESEAALRDGRYAALLKCADACGAGVIALAHHRNDLLETRIIRLIRGTGPEGLHGMEVEMQAAKGIRIWRPLLRDSRVALEDYALRQGLRRGPHWVEDPSNRDLRYLRNAVRRGLLPQIEAIRPGGLVALERSLELIVQAIPQKTAFRKQPSRPLSRLSVQSGSLLARSKVLAAWLRQQGVKNYSQAQINEALKRIDSPKKRLTFMVCGRVWDVDQSEVRLNAAPQI